MYSNVKENNRWKVCLHTAPVLSSECLEDVAVQFDSKPVATLEYVVTIFIHEVEFSVHETPGQLHGSGLPTFQLIVVCQVNIVGHSPFTAHHIVYNTVLSWIELAWYISNDKFGATRLLSAVLIKGLSAAWELRQASAWWCTGVTGCVCVCARAQVCTSVQLCLGWRMSNP